MSSEVFKSWSNPQNIFLTKLDAHIWQNKTKKEAQKVESLVKGYMSAILGDLYNTGKYKNEFHLIESGSFYEGLRVGLPYEFDFMLEIQEDVEYATLNRELRTETQSDIQKKLISDLHQCFRKRKTHKELKLREFRDHYNCPNFWFYMQYKDIGVMVDLVPCLKLHPCKLPFDLDEDMVTFIHGVVPSWSSDTSDIFEALYLVPTEIHGQWRLSTSQVELQVMKHLPDNIKQYLRVLKYLCNKYLVHEHGYDSRQIPKGEMLKLYGLKAFLPSYVLKLLFLDHLKEVHVKKIQWHQGMYSVDSLGIHQTIIRRLKEFKGKCIASASPGILKVNSLLFGRKHQIMFQCFAMLQKSDMCLNIHWYDQMINAIEIFLDEKCLLLNIEQFNLLNFPMNEAVTSPYTSGNLSSTTVL